MEVSEIWAEVMLLVSFALGNIAGLVSGFIAGAWIYHQFQKTKRK